MKYGIQETAVNAIQWIAVGACLVSGAYCAFHYFTLPEPQSLPFQEASAFEWTLVNMPHEEDWSAFQRARISVPARSGPLAKTWRLAGTFVLFDDSEDEGEGGVSKAVIDDVRGKQQYLVKEGDQIDGGLEIVRIFRDHVLVRSQGQEEELWLSFSGEPSDKKSVTEKNAQQGQRLDDMPALESNRFGKRVGEARWVLSREKLMAYYQEMMNEPERLASLFVSMKPDYKDGVIQGYYLDPAGEDDFFKAVGLSNGDTVRKVNSMRMTSQARAEYFIREFVNNRVNAIVLDIDRGGDSKKLIYLIR